MYMYSTIYVHVHVQYNMCTCTILYMYMYTSFIPQTTLAKKEDKTNYYNYITSPQIMISNEYNYNNCVSFP